MERKVVIFDHPLIQHKLSILRNENTSTKDFRELVNEIAMLMTFEATRDYLQSKLMLKLLAVLQSATTLQEENLHLFLFFVPDWVWLTVA